jgi:hypothetical protein
MGKTATLKILLPLVLLAGCSTEFRDGVDDTPVSIRSRTRSLQAWADAKDLYEGIPNQEDFGKGFRDGHYDVAMGGGGVRPVLPPREYRGVSGRSNGDQSRLSAYMDGHEHGVLAIIEHSRLLAKFSWEESQEMYEGIPHLSDFRRGYLDGFFRRSMGRKGTRPATLPRNYSGRQVESTLGMARARTYRDGFQHGSQMAEADLAADDLGTTEFAGGFQ